MLSSPPSNTCPRTTKQSKICTRQNERGSLGSKAGSLRQERLDEWWMSWAALQDRRVSIDLIDESLGGHVDEARLHDVLPMIVGR